MGGSGRSLGAAGSRPSSSRPGPGGLGSASPSSSALSSSWPTSESASGSCSSSGFSSVLLSIPLSWFWSPLPAMYYWISTLCEFMITSFEFYFCSLETLEITIYLRGARGRLALPPMKVLIFEYFYFLLHGIYTHFQGFHNGNIKRDFCGRAVAC
jgi:hypothetical protein